MKRYSLDDLQTRLDFEKGSYGKNYIINGGFDRWDYATSQTSSGYGSDNRWNNGNTNSTKIHTYMMSGDIERALFNSIIYSRTIVTSVAGASSRTIKYQFIENVTKLAGKTVTLSFLAKADASKNIAIEFFQNFGTGGTPSTAVTGIGSQLVALTSTWQKKSITVTIPSIVGKTLGTDGVHTSSIGIAFWFDAGSDFATRAANLGQQSGTFDIAEVKLEEGSVATPWTPYEGEFGGEVQACQRYYEAGTTLLDIPAYAAGVAVGAQTPFKTTKRITPTIVLDTPGESVNFASINTGIVNNFGFRITGFSIASGNLYYTNSFTASAEL